MTAYQLKALLCWASSLAICAYRAHSSIYIHVHTMYDACNTFSSTGPVLRNVGEVKCEPFLKRLNFSQQALCLIIVA